MAQVLTVLTMSGIIDDEDAFDIALSAAADQATLAACNVADADALDLVIVPPAHSGDEDDPSDPFCDALLRHVRWMRPPDEPQGPQDPDDDDGGGGGDSPEKGYKLVFNTYLSHNYGSCLFESGDRLRGTHERVTTLEHVLRLAFTATARKNVNPTANTIMSGSSTSTTPAKALVWPTLPVRHD